MAQTRRKFAGPDSRNYWLAGRFRSNDRAKGFANIHNEEGWQTQITHVAKAPKGLVWYVWVGQPKG